MALNRPAPGLAHRLRLLMDRRPGTTRKAERRSTQALMRSDFVLVHRMV
jgi:hypothetical protein